MLLEIKLKKGGKSIKKLQNKLGSQERQVNYQEQGGENSSVLNDAEAESTAPRQTETGMEKPRGGTVQAGFGELRI